MSVDETGLVQGLASGATTITASAGGVSGSLEMDVVAAELGTVSALVDDAYAGALVAGLTTETADRVATALQECSAALEQGHVLDLGDCLQQLQGESASDPTDQALLAVLGVIALRGELLLHL